MEPFLWFILYAAFILPVTKCFAIEASEGSYKADVRDYLLFGLFWPITVPAVVIGAIAEYLLSSIFNMIIALIED